MGPDLSLVAAFVFGAIVGSFLNVCIRRLPGGESVVYPGSHCPRCGATIRTWDNIPLLSYLLLRGRCRICRDPIAIRYPLVEALTGAMFALLWYHFGPTAAFGAYAAFVAALIVVSFIDWDHQIIPDVVSLPGIVLGVVCSAFGAATGPLDSIIGVVLGGGILWAVAAGYHAWTGRDGMGGGDIKLLAMIGAFLGWRGVLVTLIIGSLTGALIGIALIAVRGGDTRVPIPFGPFLALGALCALFYGNALIYWYLHFALPA